MTRRDNGLPAASYARLRDVESHLVEGLLERLRDEDVAAYVAPAPGRRGPYGETVLPDSPSDSVFVDTTRMDHAREVSDRYLVEVADELAWAGIVAAWDVPATDDVPRWPASEDVPEDDRPFGGAADPGRARGLSRVVRPAEPTSAGFGELRDAESGNPFEDTPEAEHYEPPPPPPIPLPDTLGRFAWAAVVGGPLFLLLATLLGLDIEGWPGLLALLAFVGGFVTLVARMKDRPPTDSGPDDGAVV